MGRARKKKPFFENIEITGVAAEGKALAKIDDKVIFVPFVVPGDVVDLQVVKKRKNYMEARAVKFHKYSEIRAEAFCKHFGVCGGCKWQILPYPLQLQYKQQEVIDALTRIGKVELPEIMPIKGSEKTQYYRNKLEYTFSPHRWLSKEEMDDEVKDMNAVGFHIPGLFDKIVDVEHCYLQDEPSNKIRLGVKKFALENECDFYSQRENHGLIRNLVVRTSSTGEVMVIVIFGAKDNAKIESVMSFIHENFGHEITSLQYIVNLKLNDSFADQDVVSYTGKPFIYEGMEDLKFKVGPKSFYQTNSSQAYELYAVVRNFADLTGNDLVYDLYTGTGTIALFVARSCKKIIGVEYVEEAIKDAKENAELNGIDNAQFYAGDMKDVLTNEFVAKNGTPDVIITDPPRPGMHNSVIDTILNCKPNKIVYVSCNPATQARDLALLEVSYLVAKVQPVDMFPHTHHVENVVLLMKR
ncbi:MAG: 23S rRNA (uracil(1939)-C(5))-methyltransferase RlmD [Salinivirgaceae bacterium]|nr:23S rRNA (uracil(1939)-C(5))-methyltransferase RlmD [Salinivirgaceae bacterium]